MKKIYTLLCAAALAQVAMAQPTQAITSLYTTSMYQWEDYVYDKDLKLVEAKHLGIDEALNAVEDLTYNDQGQLIQVALYQDKEPYKGVEHWREWKNMYKIHFTYNEAGQIATRYNENNIAGVGWKEGALSEYTYNEDGILTGLNIYWDWEKSRQYQQVEYKFNEDGTYSERITATMNSRGRLVVDKTEVYTYNEDGLLSEIREAAVDETDGMLNTSCYYRYTYDAQGNVVEIAKYGPSGTVVSTKHVFTYNMSLNSEDVAGPDYPEAWLTEFDYAMTHSPNAIATFEEWRTPTNISELVKYDDWTVEYAPAEEVASVKAPIAAAYGPVAMARISADAITLPAMPKDALRIYTTDGRLVISTPAAQSVSIATLPAGAYILISGSDSFRFVK